jgi:CcmD family protein
MKTILPIFLLALLAAPAGGAAQEGAASPATPEERRERLEQPPVHPPGMGAVETLPPGAVPLQQGPPRTLRAFWHVFIAYALTIVLLFGYALSIGARLGTLERRLAALGAPEAR